MAATGSVTRFAVAVIVLVAASPVATSTSAQTRPAGALLDVPYLPQTPQLCGGAAVAMVLRYWGARDVFPQDFAALVDTSANGIRASVLVGAVSDRGWQPLSRSASGAAPFDWLRREVDRGRPVIALIAVRPAVYHYVVVVGVTPDAVVFHDPARAPFYTMRRDAFDQAWAPAERWALVVLPPPSGPPAHPPPTLASTNAGAAHDSDASACASLVAANVSLAASGRLDDAEHGLLSAASRCPGSASVWTELAGLRFVQKRYAESADLARRAVDLAPDETLAWQMLATSLYVQGDTQAALDAWNQIGQPRTDVVVVEGTERVDHSVVVRLAGLPPRQILTRAAFARSERRLRELPSAAAIALRYRPQADGTASVHAAIVERPVLPTGPIGWALVGLQAGLRREVRLLVSGPLRQGEAWDVRYRWEGNRPRVFLGFQAPAPGPLPGVVGIETFWERQAYAQAEEPFREERRRAALQWSDWASERLRWQIGSATDRIGAERYVAVEGQVDTRWFSDHLAVRAGWGYWIPNSASAGFSTGDLGIGWRSRLTTREPLWTLHAGLITAGRAAPLALWPVAGSSDSRGALLRGHRLLDRGVIVSEVLGRQLAYATVEHQRPVYTRALSIVSLAGFVDLARAWQPWRQVAAPSTDIDIDIGAGLRVTAPVIDGQLRLDVGYGLLDGRTKVSAGYVLPWGR